MKKVRLKNNLLENIKKELVFYAKSVNSYIDEKDDAMYWSEYSKISLLQRICDNAGYSFMLKKERGYLDKITSITIGNWHCKIE